jgi:hypothetical protein
MPHSETLPIPIFEAVKALACGSVPRAMQHLAIYPNEYASSLVAEDGTLTPSGIDLSVEYPISSELRLKIKDAFRGNGDVSGLNLIELQLLPVLGLVDSSKKLTATGRIRAIEVLTLPDQCQSVGLSLSTIAIPKVEAKVETDALNFLTKDGAIGVACESAPFMAILQSIGVVLLRELANRKVEYSCWTSLPFVLELFLSQGLGPNGPTVDLKELTSEFQYAVEHATEEHVKRGLKENFPNSFQAKKFPQLSMAFILEVFRSLSSSQLKSIASFISQHPYGHRNGWPDLLILNNSKIRLVEIKTRDRLHFSQLRTLPVLMEIFENIEVIKVTRT